MLSSPVLRRLALRSRPLLRHWGSRNRNHWATLRKKNHPVDKALDHFDDFYKQVFGMRWPEIREGLLASKKYVAVINNYADQEQTMTKFELEGALNIRTLFNLERQYLLEEYNRSKRRRLLKSVQSSVQSGVEQNINQESIKADVETKQVDFSLKASLEAAEFDSRRLVDSINAEALHEFVPATVLKGREDYVPESTHYKYYHRDDGNFKVEFHRQYDIHFPEYLNVYCFHEGNRTDFKPSLRGATGVLNYYLMDGGSVLPILALDIRPGNTVLDMCAAPGGKSLLAIQTLYPECLVSNDSSKSRTDRIHKVYNEFLYDLKDRWLDPGKIKITLNDARWMKGEYDRILVDVPCTTDRLSLKENFNNIFAPSRIKERLKLPELQCQILVNALKLVNEDGVVVYSTCSLSPIQNDGVVHMALKQIWEETDLRFVVEDLSPALLQARSVYKFAHKKLMRYGSLVLPHVDQNYGPTYFCKLRRAS